MDKDLIKKAKKWFELKRGKGTCIIIKGELKILLGDINRGGYYVGLSRNEVERKANLWDKLPELVKMTYSEIKEYRRRIKYPNDRHLWKEDNKPPFAYDNDDEFEPYTLIENEINKETKKSK